jgi:hypothetical protein
MRKASFSVGSVLDCLADEINQALLLPINGSAERKNSDEVCESASLKRRQRHRSLPPTRVLPAGLCTFIPRDSYATDAGAGVIPNAVSRSEVAQFQW